jgi:hypothetical protein
MFSLDVQTRMILARDRIDSLAGPRRRRSAGRTETLPVRSTCARVAAVPPSTTAVRPHSNPA